MLLGGLLWKPVIGQIEPVVKAMLKVVNKTHTPAYIALSIFLKNAFVVIICVFLGMRAVVPTLVCVINGLVIGSLGGLLNYVGFSWFKYGLSLAPHGVFELSAIFLACAIGVSMYPAKEKLKLAATPLGMLMIAAFIETWISPLVVQHFS